MLHVRVVVSVLNNIATNLAHSFAGLIALLKQSIAIPTPLFILPQLFEVCLPCALSFVH